MSRRERLTSLAVVALLHLLLGWALLVSLAPNFVRGLDDRLRVFTVSDTAPPPPIVRPEPLPQPERDSAAPEPEGESTPAAQPDAGAPPLRAPPRPSDIPPPVAAGIVPGSGGETAELNSAPTWMMGGGRTEGSGTGTGGSGAGPGGGGTGGAGAGTRPELRSGRILPADYPRGAKGNQGAVEALLKISAAGRVTDCTVLRSSGNRVLDDATCRLIRERYVFNPARDPQGNPVPGERAWRQSWWQD